MFTEANKLFRKGEYQKAADLYLALYKETGAQVYKSSYDFVKKYVAIKRKGSLTSRVCICTSGVLGPTVAGGIGTAMTNLAIALKKSGAEVTILYCAHPYYARKDYRYWKDKFSESYGIEFSVIEKGKYYGTEEMVRSYEAYRYVKEERFDVAIYHDYHGLGFYSAVAKKLGQLDGTKIVVNGHGNMELSYLHGSKIKTTTKECVIKYMEAKSVELADDFVCPSKGYIDFWSSIAKIPASTTKIPNVNYIETEKLLLNDFLISRPEVEGSKVSSNDECHNYYFYSRLERLKGLEVFIEFCKRRKLFGGKKCKFWFYGNSVSIDGVKSEVFIDKQLMGSGVDYEIVLSPTPSSFFSDIKANNGVLVFASLGENSPCTVVEACQHEIPLIVSDIPGVLELLDEKSVRKCSFTTGCAEAILSRALEFEKEKIIPHLSYTNDEVKGQWSKLLLTNSSEEKRLEPKVDGLSLSVVIPTIGRVEYLEQTLAAFARQTELPLEIIVVDDGSENHIEVKEVAAKYGCTYLRTEKKFKGKACNLGAKKSNGSILVFFDDDDLPAQDYLEKIRNAYARSSVDVVSTFAEVFDNEDQSAPRYVSMALGNSFGANILENYFGKGCFAIRKDKFFGIGGYNVDEENIPLVDYRFYMKACLNKLSIEVIPEPLYFYRKNSTQSLYSSAKDSTKIYKTKRALKKILLDNHEGDVSEMISFFVDNLMPPKMVDVAGSVKGTGALAAKANSRKSTWLNESVYSVSIMAKNLSQLGRFEIDFWSSDLSHVLLAEINYERQEIYLNRKEDGAFVGGVIKSVKLPEDQFRMNITIEGPFIVFQANEEVLLKERLERKHLNIRKLAYPDGLSVRFGEVLALAN
ncbi:glycosyltransferase [Marinobacter vinifirmus]|uniref:Glycosyltransferase n=1 Tax=Marinobacter vinifirmus TaxID=355591 RepID=A0A558B2Y7_9GAMM|nr:glycosyltransferase [Marinobacter vinifirmus]TVT30875.1 MAG: glycosyltransferase [Marinobacter vinifirmus]